MDIIFKIYKFYKFNLTNNNAIRVLSLTLCLCGSLLLMRLTGCFYLPLGPENVLSHHMRAPSQILMGAENDRDPKHYKWNISKHLDQPRNSR